jgi:hypothetical protein
MRNGPLALAFHTLVVAFMLAPLVVVCLVAFTPADTLSMPGTDWSLRWFRAVFAHGDDRLWSERAGSGLVGRVGAGAFAEPVRPVAPHAGLVLVRGRLIADTASTSPAFTDLALRVGNHGHTTVNSGPARHTVADGETTAAAGDVLRDGVRMRPTGGVLTCGGTPPTALPGGSGSPSPTLLPTAPASPTGSPTPSPTPPPTSDPADPDGPGGPGGPGGGGDPDPPGDPDPDPPDPPPPPPTEPPPPPTEPPPPPPDTVPPVIVRLSVTPSIIGQVPPAGTFCGGSEVGTTTASITAAVADETDPVGDLNVRFTWTLSTGRSGGGSMQRSGDVFTDAFSVSYQQGQEPGGTITVVVTARDPAGNTASDQPRPGRPWPRRRRTRRSWKNKGRTRPPDW